MNTESNTSTDLPNELRTARRATPTFYWTVKRELWENKSIYIAPLIVAAVILLGALISAGHLPERRRTAMLLDEAHRRAAIELPYDIVAMMLITTGFIVGLRPDHSAREAERPAVRAAANHFRNQRHNAVRHVAYQHRGFTSEWFDGNELGEFQPASAICDSALQPDRHRPVARAGLRVGAARLRSGAAGDFSLGSLATIRDRDFREGYI